MNPENTKPLKDCSPRMLRVLHDFVDSANSIVSCSFDATVTNCIRLYHCTALLCETWVYSLNFCVYYWVVTPVVKRKVVDWYITQLTVWTRNYNPEIIRFSMFSRNNISGSMDIGDTKTQNIEKTPRKSTN